MTDTRSPAMTEAEISRIVKALENRGGSVSIQDPRVSQVQTWLIGLVGLGIIVTLGWLANSVDSLNRNFAGISVWKEYTDHRLDQLELRK